MDRIKDPIDLFMEWYREELRSTTVAIPSAVCLGTIGLDGYPNARTVSLKEVVNGRFIIACPLDSRKAQEIQRDNKVALTFWWPRTERQARIQGVATGISSADADRYFAEREEHIQVLTWASEQGAPLENMQALHDRYEKLRTELSTPVPRPEKWSGFAIEPVRIELMQFRHDRFHERRLFERKYGKWTFGLLQT